MKKTLFLFVLLTAQLAILAQDKYVLDKNIAYVSAQDTSAYRRECCKLDVYHPKGQKGFKTLVWFHGGGLEGGNNFFVFGYQAAYSSTTHTVSFGN